MRRHCPEEETFGSEYAPGRWTNVRPLLAVGFVCRRQERADVPRPGRRRDGPWSIQGISLTTADVSIADASLGSPGHITITGLADLDVVDPVAANQKLHNGAEDIRERHLLTSLAGAAWCQRRTIIVATGADARFLRDRCRLHRVPLSLWTEGPAGKQDQGPELLDPVEQIIRRGHEDRFAKLARGLKWPALERPNDRNTARFKSLALATLSIATLVRNHMVSEDSARSSLHNVLDAINSNDTLRQCFEDATG
jgi:hypothetical protein